MAAANNQNGEVRLHDTALKETRPVIIYTVSLHAFEQHSSVHCHAKNGLIEFNRTAAPKQQVSVVLRKKTSRILPQGEITLRQCKTSCIQLQCKILASALTGFPAGSSHTLKIFASNKN